MTYGHDAHTAGAEHAAHDHRPGFFTRWLFSTNHKDIGTLYICFAIFASVIAGALSVVMRAQLMHPHNDLIPDEQLYNVIITAHGLIMVFFVVMPATVTSYLAAASLKHLTICSVWAVSLSSLRERVSPLR